MRRYAFGPIYAGDGIGRAATVTIPLYKPERAHPPVRLHARHAVAAPDPAFDPRAFLDLVNRMAGAVGHATVIDAGNAVKTNPDIQAGTYAVAVQLAEHAS